MVRGQEFFGAGSANTALAIGVFVATAITLTG